MIVQIIMMNTINGYQDWAPGDAASWDDCAAHPDMCRGYDH